MQKYNVHLTYETTIIIESDADPDGADFEHNLALEAEKYISNAQMELTDWIVKIASQYDGEAANGE